MPPVLCEHCAKGQPRPKRVQTPGEKRVVRLAVISRRRPRLYRSGDGARPVSWSLAFCEQQQKSPPF